MEVIYYIMSKYKKDIIKETVTNFCSIPADEIRDTFVNPDKDFTRDRKLPLCSLLKIGLLNAGTCINEQLRLCCGLGDDRPTASGFIQQRDKLTVESYSALFRIHASSLTGHTLYKQKYIVVAIDGSDVNIHPNKDDVSTLCTSIAKKYRQRAAMQPVNMLHLNAAVTVPDGFFIDYEIQDLAAKNERTACANMMKRISRVDYGAMPIITCDRGYESFYLMMLADSLGLKYCIRVKDVDSGIGIASRYGDLKEADGCIDAYIDKKYTFCYFVATRPDEYPDFIYCHSNHYNPFIPPTPNKARKGGVSKGNSQLTYYGFTYRLVRFSIGDGVFETLVTNLSQEGFPLSEMKLLYHMRWGIETAFRQLKYDDCASFMHSKKKAAAVGEIVFSMIFHNLCSIILKLLALRVTQICMNRKRIYRISYSDLTAVVRFYIHGRDPTLTEKKIVRELFLTLQPIRNGRAFMRNKKHNFFIPFIYRVA